MGDFPRTPARPRFGRLRTAVVWAVTIGACLSLTGANAAPVLPARASPIVGLDAVGPPPDGPSWAPAPITTAGLRSLATAAHGKYALHTAGGEVTFLPGVNVGSTTPGHRPGEPSITAARYGSWFSAMSRLGLRAVRIATIHRPVFYQALAAHNSANPDRPLYLMQGIHLLGGRDEIRDATRAVAGNLLLRAQPGRVAGIWDTDVTPWLLGWIIGAPNGPHPGPPAAPGRYFTSTAAATPAERWLAARMDDLAGYDARRGLSQPIAALGVDAGHIRATAAWPAGTFSVSSKRPGTLPTMVTEFGVPSSIGRSEQQAMAADARLLRMIHARGLAGGFLAGWSDEWLTLNRRRAVTRPLWHDPLTGEQGRGLIATDAAGPPGAPVEYLVDDEDARPARRVTAHVDESYVWLRVALGPSPPSAVTLSLDVLPALTGAPPPGSGDRWGDAAFTLDLVRHTGQAYLRRQLDPRRFDPRGPVVAGSAPKGWRRLEGSLRHGPWTADSRSLWQLVDTDLVVRVPWAMLGYSDPSMHEIGVGTASTRISPGVGVTVSAAGTDQQAGEVTWVNWNHAYFTERLKQGASAVRDAAVTLAP